MNRAEKAAIYTLLGVVVFVPFFMGVIAGSLSNINARTPQETIKTPDNLRKETP